MSKKNGATPLKSIFFTLSGSIDAIVFQKNGRIRIKKYLPKRQHIKKNM
jgi:hypothetical protein